VSALSFLKTCTNSPYVASLRSPSSVGTIIIIVLAPSAHVTDQFIIDMERYGGISSSPDSKWFATIAPSPAVQFIVHVSASRHHLHEHTLGNHFLTVASAAPFSPFQCLAPISLTSSDAVHDHSPQLWRISHS